MDTRNAAASELKSPSDRASDGRLVIDFIGTKAPAICVDINS
jgi:hypothetical protein